MTDDRSDLRARAAAVRTAFTASSAFVAPVEHGQRLATMPRKDGELRVNWETLEGRQFLAIRLWTKSGDVHLPSKQGVT
ncbi:MAG: hypothetical protein ACHREM_14585, partial [Polyangiales bacterium]